MPLLLSIWPGLNCLLEWDSLCAISPSLRQKSLKRNTGKSPSNLRKKYINKDLDNKVHPRSSIRMLVLPGLTIKGRRKGWFKSSMSSSVRSAMTLLSPPSDKASSKISLWNLLRKYYFMQLVSRPVRQRKKWGWTWFSLKSWSPR